MTRLLAAVLVLPACAAPARQSAGTAPTPPGKGAVEAEGMRAADDTGACSPSELRAVRVATFNLQNFGSTKASDPECLTLLADTSRRHPLVALQVIQAASGSASLALLAP